MICLTGDIHQTPHPGSMDQPYTDLTEMECGLDYAKIAFEFGIKITLSEEGDFRGTVIEHGEGTGCGLEDDDISFFDWHHVGTKTDLVSNLIGTASLERLKEELDLDKRILYEGHAGTHRRRAADRPYLARHPDAAVAVKSGIPATDWHGHAMPPLPGSLPYARRSPAAGSGRAPLPPRLAAALHS